MAIESSKNLSRKTRSNSFIFVFLNVKIKSIDVIVSVGADHVQRFRFCKNQSIYIAGNNSFFRNLGFFDAWMFNFFLLTVTVLCVLFLKIILFCLFFSFQLLQNNLNF